MAHTVYATRPDAKRARVELAEHNRIPNKDFILRWNTAAEQTDVGVLTHRSGVDGFVALQLSSFRRRRVTCSPVKTST
jgi:hypothetical protein